MGTIQTIAGFYTYFVVLNDYGFKTRFLWQLGNEQGTIPMYGDVYDPLAGPCRGNSNCMKGMEMRAIEQATEKDGWVDLRLFYH